MRLDFLGVGFGRSGSAWLVKCLYEHPEISIPKFNLHTEINYFPEEYEVMGLKNYMVKFKDCDFEKRVGELSTLIIFEKRSAKLLKKLFPNTKIIIYKRDETKRAKSSKNVANNYDLVDEAILSKNPVNEINQQEYIFPWIKEFGEKNVFIFDMEKGDQQKELDRLFQFLGVKTFTPSNLKTRPNSSYVEKNGKKIVGGTKSPMIRKLINKIKLRVRKNKKLFYTLKRNFKFDYYYQLLNHSL